MCLFLVFYILLNISVGWSKNQKDIQRNFLLINQMLFNSPIYTDKHTRYTFFDIKNTMLI